MMLHTVGNQPVIHGFISRVEAERCLNEKEAGTFLLRFSETKPGKLVISFNLESEASPSRVQLEVQHCLVTVEENNFSIDFQQGNSQSYLNLTNLIEDCQRLKYLEPNIAKVRPPFEAWSQFYLSCCWLRFAELCLSRP